jgi:hypothetical protein
LPHFGRQWSAAACISLLLAAQCASIAVAATLPKESTPAWTGQGRYRVLVEVPPQQSADRTDEQIAAFDFNPTNWLGSLAGANSVDVSSLQVHQYDLQSHEPLAGGNFDGARSSYDRPCRYEDARYQNPFTSRVGRASETVDGRPAVTLRDRKDRLFNRQHDSERGRLVWSYRQLPQSKACFAIYFDLSPHTKSRSIPAAPWIGDGAPLRRAAGQSIGGFSHFTAGVGDLNGDGLFDVVAGTEKGDLFWFANQGSETVPSFGGCEILEDEVGPIDTGWYAAPTVCDWNGDGLQDLLVGTSGNVVLWWQNVGTASEAKFKYQGFVNADGKRLEVPETPVAEDSHGIFSRDYFNQPWVGDFDGDGVLDLITGGYTTGQIFWFRGIEKNDDGTPDLRYAGPLKSHGQPIDTIWAAAPAIADFDADGKLDLVTGAWWWSGIHRAPEKGETDMLWYFHGAEKHQSTDEQQPTEFVRKPMPITGSMPAGSIARPSVIDANHDGLLDLFVSESGGNAYIFLNVGTKTLPEWNVSTPALTVPWGFTRNLDVAASAADVDGDGSREMIAGSQIFSIGGSTASPELKQVGLAQVNGSPIAHAGPGYGDPYYFSILDDWDDDGRADVLWGTQQGEVYFHRKLAGDDPLAFAEGIKLTLKDGKPLFVGPPVVANESEATDFTVLQGSRIVFSAADFDADGVKDLIVGDTFANVWIFRGTRNGATDAFEPGVIITKLATRPEAVTCADWDNDGRPDLLIGGTAVTPCLVYKNTSEPGQPRVEGVKPIDGLPYLFWGPKLQATDWNQDGDVDLLVQSEFFSFWLERSFLEKGYAMATVQPQLDGSVLAERVADGKE